VGDFSQLDAVSCTSARACIAVGATYLSGSYGISSAGLIERWNGSRWSLQRSPPYFADWSLSSASCGSAKACTAVGDYVIERRNGARWRFSEPATAPNVSYSSYRSITGVSCRSGMVCTAVGSFTGNWIYAGVEATMAERSRGAGWNLQRTPSTAPADSELDSVSCTSPSACTAVGSWWTGARDQDDLGGALERFGLDDPENRQR
jgi:hypothetical protein